MARLDFPGLAFAASPIRRDAPIFHAKVDSKVIFAATSSKFIARWRHGPALESSGLSGPRGSLGAAEGRNSGVGERRLHILVFARHISLHSYGQHLRELDDVAAPDTRLCAVLVGCQALLASGT